MTHEDIIEIIMDDGYTEDEAENIFDECEMSKFEDDEDYTEDDIYDALYDWESTEKSMDRIYWGNGI